MNYNRIIKVLVLDFTPFFGGGQKFILDFNSIVKDDIDIHFALCNEELVGKLGNKKIIRVSNSIHRSIRDILAINKYIKDNKIDYVILNGNRSIYFAPFIKSKKIAYKHTSNNALDGFKMPIVSLVLNIANIFCYRMVVLYGAAINEIFWKRNKIRVISNTIVFNPQVRRPFQNEESLKFNQEDTIRLVVISRLDKNKGIDWLLKCYLALNTDILNKSVLYIAGSGSEEQNYRAYLESSSIKGNIKILGFIEDIDGLLSIADILMLPSKFECCPLSILEGLDKSLPIIATNTGGIPEMVIQNRNGFLVEYGNDKALTEAIEILVENKEMRFKMGSESKKIFESQFGNQIFRNKILNLLHE